MCHGRPPEPKGDHSLVSQKGSNYFLRIDPSNFLFKSLAVTSALGVNLEVLYSSATALWLSPVWSFDNFIYICSHGGGDGDGSSNVSINRSNRMVGMLSTRLPAVYLGRI